MKIIKNSEGLFILNDDNTPVNVSDVMAIDVHIGTDGTFATLIMPVSEIEINVPDTGVTKIKRKV